MIDVEDLVSLVRNYNPRCDAGLIRKAYAYGEQDACRADPPLGRAVFHPSGGGRGDPDRAEPRRRHHHHRAAARHHRGHQVHLYRDRGDVRPRGGGAGRWRHQADQPAADLDRDQAGGELPQAVHGDVEGSAGDPGQARRPAAQHAHDPRRCRPRSRRRRRARRWRSSRRSPAAWACSGCARSWRICRSRC